MMMHIANAWICRDRPQSQGGTRDHMTRSDVLDSHNVHMHTL
jgi:hypothetical protein